MSATETIHQASAVVPRPWRLEGSGLRILSKGIRLLSLGKIIRDREEGQTQQTGIVFFFFRFFF